MKHLFIASLTLCSLTGAAQAANFTSGNAAVKFGVHEVSFTGSGGSFSKIGTVTFRAPSGATKTVETFYDGGTTWRARAYVSEVGNWSWSLSPGNTGLSAASGTFSAGNSSLRGKIKVHPSNSRALMTDNGKWYAPIGDTGYNMLGSGSFQNYVRDDWNYGINFIRCSAFGQLRSFTSHFTTQDINGIPKLTSLQADDAKLKWLLETYPGMYLQYIMLPENAAGNWSKFSPTAQNQLLQQMIARYAAFPSITWQVMNDSAYSSTTSGDGLIATNVGNLLMNKDPYGHLRCTGARRGAGAPYATSSWTNFLHFETFDALAADEVDKHASIKKFAWCGEDRYETYKAPANNRYFNRRLMWAWLLSGGSACYGGDWDATIPYDSTSFTGLDSVKFIKGYLESRNIDLGLFAYNDALASDAQATGINRPQVCNRGTAEYIVYHPNGTGSAGGWTTNSSRAASFNLNLGAGSFQIEWFRCHDGVTAHGGTIVGGATKTLTAPWVGQDVVCRLIGGSGGADTQAPTVPTSVTAIAQSTTSILVSWADSSDNVGVAGYQVTVGGSTFNTSTTSLLHTGLAANTSYAYSVKAKDLAGNLSAAASVSGKTLASADTQAPTAPTVVVATAISESAINVSWHAAADNVGVIGYDIYRGTTTTKLGSVAGSVLSFTESGLASNSTYAYTVKARDAMGNTSVASEVVSAKTGVADTQAPTAPTQLTATASSATQIQLTWTAATDNVNVQFYEVYRNGIRITTIEAYTSYTDSGLAANTSYTYALKAKDGAGNISVASNAAIATTQSGGSSSGSVIYEAESAVVVGAVKTGTFVDFIHASTDYIEWTIQVPKAGTYTLGFRYAHSSGNRPLEIKVNGSVSIASLAFPATGSTSNYSIVSTQVTLTAGINKIRATAIGYSGSNMDYLVVTPPPAGIALLQPRESVQGTWAILKD